MSNIVTLSVNDNDEINGIITIYQTDIAALLLVNTNSSNNPDKIQLESSPFLKPIREFDGIYIIDLLYFISFMIINDPPNISFQDRVNSNKIFIKFLDIESLKNFLKEMKKKLSLKKKDPSDIYEIIKYHPRYSNNPKNHTKIVSYSHLLTEPYQIENALLVYQGIIGNIPKQREFLDFDIKTFKKENIYTLKSKSSNSFDVYLNLLNLPDPSNFDKYKNEYSDLKKQWNFFTPSQLKRSPELRDIISKIYSIVESSKNLKKDIGQISFNILMSIVQTDKRFLRNISNIFNILKIIFYIMNLVSSGNSTMLINGQYDVDLDTIESIAFWILLKIIYRFEFLELFESNSKSLFFELYEFVGNEMPFLHKFLSENYHYEDLSCLEKSMNCLFADFFELDDCVDMWSVALSFECSNYYFISLIITVLMYHFDIYEKHEQKKFPNFYSIIRDAISKLSPDFIITASALVCSNRDKLNINII